MPQSLEVWLLGQHVGSLMQVDGRLAFAYAEPWLQQAATTVGAGMALSQSLPLRPEPFDDRATRPFSPACCLKVNNGAWSPRPCRPRARTTSPCWTASAVSAPVR